MYSQAQALATYSLQVRQIEQVIIQQLRAFLPVSGNDLLAELVLHIGVLRQQMDGPARSAGGRVSASENQRSACLRVST